jgi:hypothetical protein
MRRAELPSLCGNLVPYQGTKPLMLWLEAVEKGFAAQVWMTFKQALELNAHVNENRSSLIQTPHIALELLPEPLNHLIEPATISKEQSLTRL